VTGVKTRSFFDPISTSGVLHQERWFGLDL